MWPRHMGRKRVRGGLGAAQGFDGTEGEAPAWLAGAPPAPALGPSLLTALPGGHILASRSHHFPSCPGLALLLKPGSASPLSSLVSLLRRRTAGSTALGPSTIWLFGSCLTNQTVRCEREDRRAPHPARPSARPSTALALDTEDAWAG